MNKNIILTYLLIIIISIQFIGCTASLNNHNTVNKHPLLDNHGMFHKYKDNLNRTEFLHHNKTFTQYCGAHFQYEDIKVMYNHNNYEWQYIITKNKKYSRDLK